MLNESVEGLQLLIEEKDKRIEDLRREGNIRHIRALLQELGV